MGRAITNAQGYGTYEPDFCSHYQQHDTVYRGSYDQYRPAYRYGYDLGVHTYYGAGTWLEVKLEARTLWEARNPGTWEQFKEPIHYAWTMASGKH